VANGKVDGFAESFAQYPLTRSSQNAGSIAFAVLASIRSYEHADSNAGDLA
jgi:hypothetical protein